VNGRIVENPDYWINFSRDRVLLDGKPVEPLTKRYVLLYKPKGYLTTYHDPEGRPTVYDLLKDIEQFLAPVGRLDQDTGGLLLLTNDTQLAEALTNPERHVPKVYLVKTATVLSEEWLERLRAGVELDDGPTRPAKVQRLRDSGSKSFLELTLTEGRNRQVRRMIEAAGSRVLKLTRIRIGPLSLAGLTIGHFRDLSPAEVRMLKQESNGERRPEGKPLRGRGAALRKRTRNTRNDRS
jgi:pseudouridine synthase